jgi:glycosyltransferase involved in cell wall biosynthesis
VYSDFRGGPVPAPDGLPVVLHGAQPHAQVLARFREAHVYVMPSRRDSYGFVFIEAMANGCATIMPDRAVQREMSADGTAGMLVPAGDSAALTLALLQLIDEPARRLEIALAGHQRYLENYDADPVGRRFTEAFGDAVRNGAGQGT